jgi:predicted Zn-dependent protease
MRDAGYDPLEAVIFWHRYIKELKEKNEEVDQDLFRSQHPTTEERIKILEREAKCLIQDEPKIRTDRDRFIKTVLPHQREFICDELDLKPFSKTEILLNMLLEDEKNNSSEIYFYQGELWRRRGQSTDLEAALTAYKKANESGTPPPELFRSMGEVLIKTGDLLGAKQAFQQYLKLNPDAQDRKIIEQMLK